ncbi:TIGR01841 family phasin [Pseudoduganella violacea]|uniref:Phasin family protein n=1 Tax=Pseudoduganella violacea TaxID=1715466 RepID=A0A7W5B7F3_9BURK|nr:TIGR01841 family phasin [Pseudoduganella violacea]MBB3117946.1 phasin family protein [Pseudoduganella violacea]
MSSITEQLSAATKTQLESQLNILNHIASTTFDGAQQVIALNLSTTKASVENSAAAARQLLEAKDSGDLLSLVQAPGFDRLFAYGRELFAIVSKTQAGLLQAAKDQFQDASAAVTAAVPQLSEVISEPVAQVAQAVQAAAPVVTPEPLVVAQPEQETGEQDEPSDIAAAVKSAIKAKPAASKPSLEAAPIEPEDISPAKPAAASFPEVKPAVNLKSVSTKPKK